MIEVIYDKNKENADTKEENIKKDATEVKRENIGTRLPKNIRQIGTPEAGKRIYIEDYVVTYLNYISRPGSTRARGAILLGEQKQSDVGNVLFISGAVEAQNLEFDMDESQFTKEAWTQIYDQVKEFFPDLSVVGWFLSRMGFSTAINDKIEKMHIDNFPGRDKVLYVTDSLEADDAFYMYEHGQMIKQKGYYIYYSKNEAMQNYIIKQKGGVGEEENTEIHRKDEELIKNYREKNNRVQGTKQGGVNLIYVASSFVVLAMLAMGITVVSNYDKMKEMEVSINRLELTADITTEDILETMNDNDYIQNTQDKTDRYIENSTDTQPEEENTENSEQAVIDEDEKNENNTTEDGQTGIDSESSEAITTEQYLPTITNGNPTYYDIKYGDTLSSIALDNYGSVIYAGDIAEANNMDVDDRIYEGDRIILPSISIGE